jgi:hypothetical protein
MFKTKKLTRLTKKEKREKFNYENRVTRESKEIFLNTHKPYPEFEEWVFNRFTGVTDKEIVKKQYDDRINKFEMDEVAQSHFDWIRDYLDKNRGDQMYLMADNYLIDQKKPYDRFGKFAILNTTTTCDFKPRGAEENGQETIVLAGSDAFIPISRHLFDNGGNGIIIGNVTKGEVISQYSQTREVEKKVYETKIQKQEVNSGISLKKIEKELQKARHILLKKYPKNVVDDILETVFNRIKDL